MDGREGVGSDELVVPVAAAADRVVLAVAVTGLVVAVGVRERVRG